MTYWQLEHHLIDEDGRDVCTVFYDAENKCWAFEDFHGYSESGFATDEKAISYCDEYMWNNYGI